MNVWMQDAQDKQNGHHKDVSIDSGSSLTMDDLASNSGGLMLRGKGLFMELEVAPLGREIYKNPYPETEVVDGSPEQYKAIEKSVRDLMNAINVNWEDPNYIKTPERVARAYLEYWLSGYGRDPKDEITVFPNISGSDDLVIVKDMRWYSLCAHHMAQIEGYAAIAYVPDKQLLGLSKLGRILEIYSRRFQMQERIGAQVADALMELIKPKAVMVVLYNATHGCMSSRGIKMHEANTTTSAIRGAFKEPEGATLRKEAMDLINLRS